MYIKHFIEPNIDNPVDTDRWEELQHLSNVKLLENLYFLRPTNEQ